MQLPAPLTVVLTFLVGTLSANLHPRDAGVVLADISTISNQTATVQANIDAFQGGPNSASAALKIKTASDVLDKTLQKSAQDAASSPAFSESESAAIANAVTGLQPAIFKVLNSLVAKKDGFRTALGDQGGSVVSLVNSTVRTLRMDTGAFGGNVTVKLSTEYRRIAPLLLSNIDFHFARAVDAFSTP